MSGLPRVREPSLKYRAVPPFGDPVGESLELHEESSYVEHWSSESRQNSNCQSFQLEFRSKSSLIRLERAACASRSSSVGTELPHGIGPVAGRGAVASRLSQGLELLHGERRLDGTLRGEERRREGEPLRSRRGSRSVRRGDGGRARGEAGRGPRAGADPVTCSGGPYFAR